MCERLTGVLRPRQTACIAKNCTCDAGPRETTDGLKALSVLVLYVSYPGRAPPHTHSMQRRPRAHPDHRRCLSPPRGRPTVVHDARREGGISPAAGTRLGWQPYTPALVDVAPRPMRGDRPPLGAQATHRPRTRSRRLPAHPAPPTPLLCRAAGWYEIVLRAADLGTTLAGQRRQCWYALASTVRVGG